MAQQARVPKFGDWESGGDVPYTQYFDNARKGKFAGKFINPNDPQENPESFSEDLPPVRPPPFRPAFDPEAPKPKNGDRRPTDSPLRKPPSDSPQHRYGDRGNPSDPNRRANRLNTGSDRSFEQSPLHPIYQPKSGSRVGVNSPSWERRESSEGHGLTPNTPERARTRPGGRGDEIPEKGSTVPKFGEWDESNPSSADGYTIIFNKVRQQKQVGPESVPAVSNKASYHNGHKPDNSFESTGCGCFGWGKNRG